MLEGVQFDIIELPKAPEETEQVHQRTTDADGLAEIIFYGPTRVQIRELLRQSGGQWGITTPHDRRGRDWYILPARVPELVTDPVVQLPAALPGGDIKSQQVGEYRHGGDCDDVDLWVGNARSFLPKTGAGGKGSGRSQQVDVGVSFD
jgi:hypothetical protein